MRRSAPQTFSTSSASWRPSTKMRLALATRAGASVTAKEPDAVLARPFGAAMVGFTSTTGSPSMRKPLPSGKRRSLPRPSSSVTMFFSTRTTAPQNPVATSSTTRSRVASCFGITVRPASRQPGESTSCPYRSSITRSTLAEPHRKSREAVCAAIVRFSNRSAIRFVTPSGERSRMPRTTRAGDSLAIRR